MDRDYLQAAHPERVTILGLTLRPFALGHVELLLRLDSPFVRGGDIAREDLVLAVLICAHTFEDATALLDSEDLASVIAEWERLTNPRSLWSRLFARARVAPPFDLDEKINLFEQYLTRGSLSPDLHELPGNSREPGAPFVERVRLVLMSRLGFTYSAAMNYPWGLALHDYFAFWELEGAVRLFSAQDAEHLSTVKREREQIILDTLPPDHPEVLAIRTRNTQHATRNTP
jgi:hypothetical protein